MYTALIIGVVGLLLWGLCARIELANMSGRQPIDPSPFSRIWVSDSS